MTTKNRSNLNSSNKENLITQVQNNSQSSSAAKPANSKFNHNLSSEEIETTIRKGNHAQA